jgi:ribose transport system permease protein
MTTTATPATRERGARRTRRRTAPLTSTQLVYVVLGLIVVVSALLTLTKDRNFFSQGNLWTIFTAMTVLGFIAIGQTLVILAGSLDLSVTYVASLTTLVAGGIMAGNNANMVRGVLTALAVAAVIGLASGLIVTLLDVHGFIATLGVGLIISGYLASNYQGSTGQAADDLEFFGVTGIGVMPYVAMFMFLAAAIVWAALRWTRWGHHLYAVGGNRSVARMSGLRTAYPVITAHVLCALFAALAGLTLLSRTGIGSPTIGSQGRYDLFSIAAVVLGGTLLAGGKGSIVGTIGGVAIFAVLDNVMGVMGINPFLKDFVRGLIIVLAVAVYARRSIVRRPARFGHASALGSVLKEDA